MSIYWTLSERRETDSRYRSMLIQEGIAQWSWGTSSAKYLVSLALCFDRDGRVCRKLFGSHTIAHLRLGRRFRLLLELFCERHIIEEGPWVVKFVIPRPFQILHALQQIVQLLISHEGKDGGVYARAVRARCVVVAVDSAERLWRLARHYLYNLALKLVTHEEEEKERTI